LIELSIELADRENQPDRILMVIGEGSVFLLILLLGLWKIRSSIQKDIRLSQRQSNFLLSVTHELKTPLASNKLYLQTLLKRSTLDREKQEELINHAIVENNRLENMIENILTATRIENHVFKLQLETIDLSKLLKFTAQKWSNQRRELAYDIQEDIAANVDSFVFETVLLNLLDNAYKYSGDSSTIEVYLKRKGDNLIWGVKDNGQGVPEKFAATIFDKFVRIGNEETRLEKGTGLGLYITRQLIKAHGGEIQYLNNEPTGANFKITLNDHE
jgi:K+-sensing histidine kinase KdpD